MEHLKKIWWIVPTLLAIVGFLMNLYIQFLLRGDKVDRLESEVKELRVFKQSILYRNVQIDTWMQMRYNFKLKKQNEQVLDTSKWSSSNGEKEVKKTVEDKSK